MSQSSQGSVGTQEIISQSSFDEIWQTLGRTFSNPEKIVQGVLTEEIPTVIEYKDQSGPDNLEITYQQRSFRNTCLPNSQQFSDLDAHIDPNSLATTNCNQNGHYSPLINGNSHGGCTSPLIPSAHVDAVHLPPILPNTNYPGAYNFSISFEPNSGPITKATPWVYQEEHHKLFVKMQCVCPILFKYQGNPPPGSIVRGILTYKRPENYKDIVVRCPNHRNTCKDGHPFQDHVMRCENSATRYEVCPSTNRLSIVIPLRATNVVVGEGYFKELFKFTCFNSCVGGMNRRPTNLLFRLECGGEVYARALVEVRICASPGRDCNEKESGSGAKNAKENEKRASNEPSSTTDIVAAVPLPSAVSSSSPTSPTTCYPHRASVLMSTRKDDSCVVQEPFQFPNVPVTQRKRPCTATNGVVYSKVRRTSLADPNDDELFTLVIRGRERFEMLSTIKDGLELLDGIRPRDSNQPRPAQSEYTPSSPEFTRIKPKPQSVVQVKREEGRNHQCSNQAETSSPQSSQETSPLNLSQLSRTSSNASSQSSHTAEEYSAWQVTLKRTLNIDAFSHPRSKPNSQ